MAYLLTLKSNYIWLDDIDTGKRYEGLAKDVLIRSDLDDSTTFYFDGLNQFDKNIGIAFGDIDVNGNGAFGTLAEWQDWYTANTGNFNGGGSAPTILTVNQDGSTNPPTDNVGDIVWTYVEQGIYTGVLAGYFAGKTPILYPNQANVISICNILDSDTIEIRTYNASGDFEADGLLLNAKLILY